MPLPAGLASIISIFGHRNYAFYMGGQTPYLITVWMQRLGVGWLAWELTHSTVWLGVIAAADLVPMLLLSPLAGAITDRGVPLTLQKITQVLAVVQALGLAVLTYAGWIEIWGILGLTLFHGLAHTLASTARHAVVPSTVPRPELSTAIAVDSAIFNGSRFIGPALAGLIIPFAGVGGTFVANVLGASGFLIAMFFMNLAPPVREDRGRRSVFADIGESLAYVRGHVGIGPLFWILAVASILFRPIQDMLPGFAGDVYGRGAVGLAWLTSAMGVGATVAACWIALRGRITGLTNAVIAGYLGLAIATLGLVATPTLWIAVIFAVFSGFALNAMSTSCQVLVQYAVDDSYRGRVMGLYTLIYRGIPAIGALVLGAAAEFAGLRGTFAVVAVVAIIIWVPALSRLRTMRAGLEYENP